MPSEYEAEGDGLFWLAYAQRSPQRAGYDAMAEHDSFSMADHGAAPSTSDLSLSSLSDASSTICPSLWSVTTADTFAASSSFHELDWMTFAAKESDRRPENDDQISWPNNEIA